MKPPSMRWLADYTWEDGSHLEIRLVGHIDSKVALETARTLLGIKEQELAAAPSLPCPEKE